MVGGVPVCSAAAAHQWEETPNDLTNSQSYLENTENGFLKKNPIESVLKQQLCAFCHCSRSHSHSTVSSLHSSILTQPRHLILSPSR